MITMNNTKGSTLLYFDVAIAAADSTNTAAGQQKQKQLQLQTEQLEQNEIGRIFIEPIQTSAENANSNNFAQIFAAVARGLKERGKGGIIGGSSGLAKLIEAKRNAYVKFAFDKEAINRLTEGQQQQSINNSIVVINNNQGDQQNTMHQERNGLVIMNSNTNNNNPAFYILTSSWSAPQQINIGPGDGDHLVVGTIFKGMDLVQHVSWFGGGGADTNDLKVTENCYVTDMGLISTGQDLGIKQRDSVLDPFPDMPGDSDLDYRDFEKFLTVAFKIKASGSLLFRQERYQMARFRFGKAVRYLSWVTERQKITMDMELKALQIIVPCIVNSAACRLKIRDFDGALEDCNEALELCPKYAKAYFRRGQAYHGMMKYEQSLCDLYTALKMLPNDRAIKNEIAAVEGEMQVYKKVPSRRNSEETAMQVQ